MAYAPVQTNLYNNSGPNDRSMAISSAQSSVPTQSALGVSDDASKATMGVSGIGAAQQGSRSYSGQQGYAPAQFSGPDAEVSVAPVSAGVASAPVSSESSAGGMSMPPPNLGKVDTSNFTSLGVGIGSAGGIPGMIGGGAIGFGIDYFMAGEERERQKKLLDKQFKFMERQERKKRQFASRENTLSRNESARQFNATMDFRKEENKTAKAQRFLQAMQTYHASRFQNKMNIKEQGFF